jgi:hypothetical protein
MIADHPRLGRRRAERAQHVAIDRLVGLPHPELALDQDRLEEAPQAVPLDLVALLRGVAVRHQRQRHAAPPQRRQTVERLREQAHARATPRRVVTRDGGRQVRGRPAQALERERHDVLPGAEHVLAFPLLALRIVPEPAPRVGDGGHQRRGVELGGDTARRARLRPAPVRVAGVVEQRVVEIDQ